MKHYERELKINLQNRSAYLSILESNIEIVDVLQQKNYFFDTIKDDLKKNKIALRIREENGQFFITVKGKRIDDNTSGVSIREEYEEIIVQKLAKKIINEQLSVFTLDLAPISWLNKQIKNNLLSQGMKKIAEFVNIRHIIKYEDLILELDNTRFSNGIHAYELEVEFVSDESIKNGIKNIKKFLKSLNIDFLLSKESKFVNALHNM